MPTPPWKHWSPARLGLACAVLAALGFSFKAIFVKLAYAVPQAQAVDAVTLLALRMVLSLPVFVWIGWRARHHLPPLSRRDGAMVLALGLLGYYGASILDFMGLQYISAGLERLILFIYPTLTLIISVLFLGKRASRTELAALLLSYLGIGLAFAHDMHLSNDLPTLLTGAALILGSALSYAFYQAGSEPVLARLGAARFTALTLTVATFATLGQFATHHSWAALQQPPQVYLYTLGMAVFSTVLPVFMAAAAIRRIGAARTAMIGTLGPVLTIFFSAWLLYEPLSLAQLAGAGLVVSGVVLLGRSKTAAAQPKEDAPTSTMAST